MWCQNVGGLRTQLLNHQLGVLSTVYNVIIICKSCLNIDLTNEGIGLYRYKIFEADRKALYSLKIRSGGVLIAMKFCF